MQEIFKECRALFASFHQITKNILKYGMPFVIGLLSSGVFCFLMAGHIGMHDKMLRLAEDFLLCGRETLSVLLLGALLFELMQKTLAYDAARGRF